MDKTKAIDKIHGCLLGLAVGDAMGMPGLYSIDRTKEIFGEELNTFVDAADDPEIDPVHYKLLAGMVTDDTFAAFSIVKGITQYKEVTVDIFVKSYIDWVEHANALSISLGRDRGLSGPSTTKAIEMLKSGTSPYITGKTGQTNGAAMRVAPIGFLYPGDIQATVDATEISCIPTHNTNVAISAASAISCAVTVMAAGVDDLDEILDAAKHGAELGKERGIKVYCPSVAKRIDLAVQLASSNKNKADIRQDIYDLIGTYLPAYEVVPAAIGVFMLERGDPISTIHSSINVGGDGDTLGAIAGALAGTLNGYSSFPPKYSEVIESVNYFKLRQKSEAFYQAIQELSPL